MEFDLNYIIVPKKLGLLPELKAAISRIRVCIASPKKYQIAGNGTKYLITELGTGEIGARTL